MQDQTVKGRFGSAYRAARSLRVVLVFERQGAEKTPLSGRRREFEEQTARLEAQLGVLEQDTAGSNDELSPAGRRIRVRRLEMTRAQLCEHLQNAKKHCRQATAIVRLQDQLEAAGRPNAPRIHIDGVDLSDAPVNLDRLADALFLFDEIRSRLDRSGRTGTKKEDGREEGVA